MGNYINKYTWDQFLGNECEHRNHISRLCMTNEDLNKEVFQDPESKVTWYIILNENF